MNSSAPRSPYLDYAVGICSVWISAGFFLDAWAHGHVPIESFFTPYHAAFYSGMLAMILVLAAFVARNRMRGYGWRASLPPGYHLAVLGLPIFFLAGIGDLCWHLVFGVEEGVDALLSPSHQALGLGLFLLAAGPIRSVLADRGNATRLSQQLPLVLGLASWLILVHFGTAYAFDPGADSGNAPPSIAHLSSDYMTSIAIGYYKIATGMLTTILQALIVSAFALWAASRIALRPGSYTLLFLIGNIPAAAAFTNATSLLTVTILASLATGIVADILVARLDPQPENVRAYRIFALAVPMTYCGLYLLSTLVADRLWWDWNVALGAWLWTGIIGFALSLIGTARRTPT